MNIITFHSDFKVFLLTVIVVIISILARVFCCGFDILGENTGSVSAP